MAEEQVTIVTMRKADISPILRGTGVVVEANCDECGHTVNITSTSFPHMNQPHRVICNVCIAPKLAKMDINEVEMEACDPDFSQLIRSDKQAIVEWMIENGVKNS